MYVFATNRERLARLFLMMAVVAGVGLLNPAEAGAHYLWLIGDSEPGEPVVHAFLSETPNPDLPEFLKAIENTQATADGQTLPLTRGDDTYRVALPKSRPRSVTASCDLGVRHRGEAVFRLIYTARVQFSPVPASEAEEGDLLRLRLVEQAGGSPVVRVTFRGQPAAGATIKTFPEEGEPVESRADENGEVNVPGLSEGRTALLAKWTEQTPGEQDGQAYSESRYYATLTVAPAAFAPLPEAVNSFGGAVLGDWLYVYSGHTGKTHHYHVNTTTKHFRRLNLVDRTTWEELPPGPPLQGVALVAHARKLYRIGGMSAHNAPGQPHDLISVADFACYDPETRTWTDLPALPEPRSTHDAVVVGDKLYVVGGWTMSGGDSVNTEFCSDALVFDLSRPEGTWEPLPTPPFRRRALAAATIAGKVYVLGGLTEDNEVVKSVDIYDPATQTWSLGPDLPGSRIQGFAPSAFGVAGRLYVSGRDGSVLRLNQEGNGWEVVGQLAHPRLTHRMLPGTSDNLLIVGGNAGNGPTTSIESIPLGDPEPTR